MRWLFDMYLPVARRGQRELRTPLARLLVCLVCLLGAAWLCWLSVHAYLASPTTLMPALLLLTVPLLGALYLLYVMYLVLFASGRRVKQGLIPRPYLRLFGYLLIPFGFWMLSQGRLDGALSVVAGLACLGLARQRSGWSFGDER